MLQQNSAIRSADSKKDSLQYRTNFLHQGRQTLQEESRRSRKKMNGMEAAGKKKSTVNRQVIRYSYKRKRRKKNRNLQAVCSSRKEGSCTQSVSGSNRQLCRQPSPPWRGAGRKRQNGKRPGGGFSGHDDGNRKEVGTRQIFRSQKRGNASFYPFRNASGVCPDHCLNAR